MPATHDPRPIGVFDSGLGGLTAVRELFRQLPSESIVYFGDTARLPYGNKSGETVTRFSLEIASFLVRQHVKCIVVACNTASSHALDALRERFGVPVIGVIEPAARAAVSASTRGRIGVVGTLATVGSTADLLAAKGLLTPPGAREPVHHFYLSDEPRRRSFARVAETFLGRPLPPVSVVDQTDLPWYERLHDTGHGSVRHAATSPPE